MTLLDLVGLVLSAPNPIGVPPLSSLIAYAKHEPVRVVTAAIAAALFALSILTGTPLAVLVGEVLGTIGLLEKVRKVVTPMAEVVVHAHDVPDGHVVQVVPGEAPEGGAS